ncbi:hypothetical protein L345_17721, partial [Ophiophagus hannah]
MRLARLASTPTARSWWWARSRAGNGHREPWGQEGGRQRSLGGPFCSALLPSGRGLWDGLNGCPKEGSPLPALERFLCLDKGEDAEGQVDRAVRICSPWGVLACRDISPFCLQPDGKHLALGSHDNFVYIYLVSEGGRKYGRVGKCSGHSSFITHLDWAFDSSCLVTNSGDYEILYWIWPEGADGTDINAVCRSHEGKLLASADDFGKVHLFSYPCCQPR